MIHCMQAFLKMLLCVLKCVNTEAFACMLHLLQRKGMQICKTRLPDTLVEKNALGENLRK